MNKKLDKLNAEYKRLDKKVKKLITKRSAISKAIAIAESKFNEGDRIINNKGGEAIVVEITKWGEKIAKITLAGVPSKKHVHMYENENWVVKE